MLIPIANIPLRSATGVMYRAEVQDSSTEIYLALSKLALMKRFVVQQA
jgi:hypothetical protein